MKQTCKFCKSEIDGECYKCPVCREWLHPFKFSKNNPYLQRYLLILTVALTVIIVPRYIETLFLSKRIEFKNFQSPEAHRLKILWSKVGNEGNQKIVLGELENEGTNTFTSIDIEVYFYDKDKNLLKIGNAYITGNIKPGQVRLFQVLHVCECNIDAKVFNGFDSYEIKIVNGYINQSKN